MILHDGTLMRDQSVFEGRRPIVIYDSGVGGLTVAKHVQLLFPKIDLLYVADNGWYPYGNKAGGHVGSRAWSLINSLVESVQPLGIVVACNTASLAMHGIPGVNEAIPYVCVTPPIPQAVSLTKTGNISLLATPSTISNVAVQNHVLKYFRDAKIWSIGAQPLVDIVERKLARELIGQVEIIEILDAVISSADRDVVDVVILGCTHFPHIKEELMAGFKNAVHWIDPAYEAAFKLKEFVDAGQVGSCSTPVRTLALTSPHKRDKLTAVFSAHGFGDSNAAARPLAEIY